MLAKAFLILTDCLVVRNNSCVNASSWEFFLFILTIGPVLFFAEDFNLFYCVFFSLTLTSWYFTIFYNIVTLPWENFNLVSLTFSKIVRTNIDSLTAISLSGFFNCPMNCNCWIASRSESNAFCILWSNVINV